MAKPVALVTGATEGIGRATAFALARAGYSVGLTARTAATVTGLAETLRAEGHAAEGAAGDVSDPHSVAAVIDHIENDLGPIDVLVNNAGVLIGKPFLQTSIEDWDRTFAVNVRGVFLATRAVLPGMVSRGRGDIVNIASLAGKNGVANAAAYSASKHAVIGFSRSLLPEVRGAGVRVITVCPGSVDTPMMRNQEVFNPDFERILTAEDVAATVVDALRLPRRALISEIEVRPASP